MVYQPAAAERTAQELAAAPAGETPRDPGVSDSPTDQAVAPQIVAGASRPGQADSVDIADPAEHPIVFFDGDCAFCNWSVVTLFARDTRQTLRFAPLQGVTALGRVPEEDRRRLDTLVLLDGQGVSRRSTAIVRILAHLGGRYRVLSWLLWLIPAVIRNTGYRVVARYRKLLIGHSACRLATPAQRQRLYP